MVIICSSKYELSLYADNESSSLSSSIGRCLDDHLSLLACARLTSLYVGQAVARDADTWLSISDVVPEPEVDVAKPRDVDVTAHFNMAINDENR